MHISRSYYKIKEIDLKYNLIKKKIFLIELGCYPGGWSEYIYKKNKNFIKIDLKKPKFLFGNFLKGDFDSFNIYKKIFLYSNYKKPHLILSDLSPRISKTKIENKIIFEKMINKIIKFTFFFLKKKGNLVFKNMDYNNDLLSLKNFLSYFKKIYKIKLKSSKIKSSEIFYVCKSFLHEF